jgi:alpha-beta hydrolase superfamily lysophospholipase
MHTAAELAGLSAAAYSSPGTWSVGCQRAVLTGDVIAFRGTVPSSIGDWLCDFDAVPVEDQHLGTCHQGFLDGVHELLPFILKDTDPHTPLVITGHSLGGALAVLSAAMLVAMGRPVAGLTTFGAPRAAGDRVRSLLAAVPVVQFRQGDDPVPLVPWMPGVFDHVVALTQIGVPSLDPIDDHEIAGYAAVLAKLGAPIASAAAPVTVTAVAG